MHYVLYRQLTAYSMIVPSVRSALKTHYIRLINLSWVRTKHFGHNSNAVKPQETTVNKPDMFYYRIPIHE